MKKNKRFTGFIILIILSLLFVFTLSYSFQYENVKFTLPPVMSTFNLKPTGSHAWMATYGLKVTNSPAGLSASAYFPDGKSIVAGDDGDNEGSFSDAGNVTRIDLMTNRLMWKVKPFQGTLHGGNFAAIKELTVSSDSRYISVITTNIRENAPNEVKILNANNGQTYKTFSKASFLPQCSGTRYGKVNMLHPQSVRFSPDARFIYVFYTNSIGKNYGDCLIVQDRWLFKYELSSGREVWKIQILTPGDQRLGIPPDSVSLPKQVFEINKNGNLILVGNAVGSIEALNTNTGRKLYTIPTYLHQSKNTRLVGAHKIFDIKFDTTNNNIVYVSLSDYANKSVIAKVDLSQRRFTGEHIAGVACPMPFILLSSDMSIFGAGGTQLYMWDMRNKKVIFNLQSGGKNARQGGFNPVYAEAALVYSQGFIFVHRRGYKNITVSDRWTKTGVFVGPATGYYIKVIGEGEVYRDVNISVNDDAERAYSVSEELFDGWERTKRGELFIKSDRAGHTRRVRIYGGLSRAERNISTIRNNLVKWGNFQPVSNQGETEQTPEVGREERSNLSQRTNIVKEKLIELGTLFKAASFTGNFNVNAWATHVKNADSPQAVGKLLALLVRSLGTNVFDNRWAQKSRFFFRDCTKAGTYIEVANSMISMEDHIISNSMHDDFKYKRKFWLRDLEKAVNDGEIERSVNEGR